jgi:uncharacterized protein (DUF2141 family)
LPRQGLPRAARWGALPALLLALLLAAGQSGAQEAVLHAWQRIYYAALDGKESLLFVERFDRAKPALADIDGDGKLDLFLGAAEGRVMFFQNVGTAQAPRWHLANPAIPAVQGSDPEGEPSPIDVGDNAAPALVDIDGDGDLDLFVGSAAGRIFFFRNEGNRFLPSFRLVSADFLGQRVGLNVVPTFPDVNGDGLPDLSFGNEAGEYYLALNQGTRANPRYCLERQSTPDCLHVLTRLGQLDPEDNAVPVWSDWDGDGDLDLFVGKSDGTVAYFQNIGTRQDGAWELREARFNILDSGGFAAPAFADVNGDGAPDLLLAGDGEQIAYYTRRPQDPTSPLWLEDKNVLQVRRLGGFSSNVHVAVGDLNADAKPDLLVGTRGGELFYYENVGTPQAPAFRSPTAPLLPTPQRAFAAPALVDIDGDGDLDLIAGGREGRLEWIENTGTPRQPRWSARSLFFGRVDVGGLSVPLFADLDGDGDPDLLVGNRAGAVVYYENVGTARVPRFELRATRFAGLQVPNNASPGLFPWNPQSPPDLVVGNQSGSLIPAVRNPAVKVAERDAFQPERAWGGGLQAGSYSAPLFADLSGDKRPDLLLGTGPGGLLFWRYEGSAKPAQLAKAQRPRGSNIVAEAPATTQRPAPGAPGAAPPGVAGPRAAAVAPEDLPLEPIFVYEPSTLEKLNLGHSSKPAFFDANGDGRTDLVVGTGDGKLVLLENSGDRSNPTWRLVTDTFAGYDKGRNAAPAFADVDGDGDLDLVVGNEQGLVFYYENTGSRSQPRFTLREDVLALVRAGRNAVPALADLNSDGRPDLLVGNLKGELLAYTNNTGLRFDLAIRRFIGIDVGVNSAPTFAHLTGRDVPFLVIGSDQGLMHIYGATGTSRLRSSGWKEIRSYLEGLKMPAGSAAAFADVDGDGDLDMVLGSDKGMLTFYRNQARQPELAQSPTPRR